MNGSLIEFDRAIELDPRQKACMQFFLCAFSIFVIEIQFLIRFEMLILYAEMLLCTASFSDLWQRGLSLYYLNK